MTATYRINGSIVTEVRAEDVELSQNAEHGQVGGGRIRIDDTAGTLVVTGQKAVTVDETDCSSTSAFRGYVAEREYARQEEVVGASREITVSLEDLNAALGFRGIVGTDRKRPAETVAARGAWLMASAYVSGLFADNGRCTFSSAKGMDEADYTDQFPGDVLADMALAQGGVNYYVRDFGAGPELVFRDDNASTADTSTIHISNVAGEDDQNTIFYPSKDFSLRRSPDKVKSKLAYQYAKGRVVEERTATATTFNGERFGVASNSNVKTAAKASEEAVSELWQMSTEEDVLEGQILVPSSHANLLNHGDRIGIRLQHFTPEGYYNAGSWIYCRVLELTRKPIVSEQLLYELSVRLSPQEAAQPVAGIVQSVFFRGAGGGATPVLPNPVTVGNKLIAIISDRNDVDPAAPQTANPALPRFGSTAWTRFNGATLTKSTATGYGISAYYKTADSTSQSGFIAGANAVVAIFELGSAANPAGAVIQYVSQGTAGPTHDIAASTVVAAGEVAIAAWNLASPVGWSWDYSNSYPWQSPNPPPNINAGWTLGISKWSYDHYSLSAYIPAEPWTTIGYTTTAGSIVPRITPGGTSHSWAGFTLRIP